MEPILGQMFTMDLDVIPHGVLGPTKGDVLSRFSLYL